MRSRTGSESGNTRHPPASPHAPSGGCGNPRAAEPVGPAAKPVPQAVSEVTSTFTPGPIVEDSDTFFT
jgi:hypothetical protein